MWILVLGTVLGFVMMEILSYVLHRYLFHGALWFIHESHHRTRHGWFETNDLFSFGFAIAAIVMMFTADSVLDSWLFALGCGMTLYGFCYFIAHDLYVHRRPFSFQTSWNWLNRLRAAHRTHHQKSDRLGQEPFGLFWF